MCLSKNGSSGTNRILRIVQTIWSCNQGNLMTFNAGWLSPKYHLMGWALSCLQLKRFYDEVCLYADSESARMLIDKLGLPYSEVVCNLDTFDSYHPKLWALPKINTYSKQETPFLHVDGDVFIWQAFDQHLLKGELICQNEEAATEYYETIFPALASNLAYLPREIIEERNLNRPIRAYNAGILGGIDYTFYKRYASKAFELVDRNKAALQSIDVNAFNIFFEQYLFYCMSRQAKHQVRVLITELISDNRYRGFGDFIDVPHSKQYLHLIGGYKKNKTVCDQMAARLRHDHPEYYERILRMFKKDTFTRPDHSPQKEKVRFRYNLVKKYLHSHEELEDLLSDVENFENKLFSIVEGFDSVPQELLDKRDLEAITYGEYIFSNRSEVLEKKVVAEESAGMIRSKYRWSIVGRDGDDIHSLFSSVFHSEEQQFLTLVVAECNQPGYALHLIDELDCAILKLIAQPMQITDLMVQLEKLFDADDLEHSRAEFHQLIFGRIKQGLVNKGIKAVKM
jgi:hypothetical protein